MSFFPTPIIVGVDGNGQSRRAMEVAGELARATGSPLHLLHVAQLDRGLHGRPITPRQREVTDESGQQLLDVEVARARELGIEVSATHLREGEDVARTMAAAASELEAGLLVLGDSHSNRVVELLSRTSTTTAVRRTRGSVMVVR